MQQVLSDSEIRTGRQDTGGRQGGRVPSNMLVGSWLVTTQARLARKEGEAVRGKPRKKP